MSYTLELTRSGRDDLNDIVDWIARNDPLGMEKCREVFFKPYRIIYHIRGERVIVNLIADGRRDMEALLQRRLVNAG